MRKLLSLKLLTSKIKTPTNNPFNYLLKPTPIHHPHCSPYGHLFAEYATTALTNFCSKPNNTVGIFAKPNPFKQFLSNSNTLFKGPAKGLVYFKEGFMRKSYNFGSSYKSRSTGWRWIQRFDSDQVVVGLIVTNVAVFLLWRVADRQFMRKNFMISVDNFRCGRIHTVITSAFSHIEIGHIISNMIGLYFFGTSIGRIFGAEFLLKLYLSGAVAGSVFYLVYHAFMSSLFKSKQKSVIDPAYIPGLGASGAVNAIMLLDIFLHPRNTLYLEFFIPVPAVLLGIFIIGKDLLRIIEGDPQVSGSAHLGGATVAAVAWLLCRRRRLY